MVSGYLCVCLFLFVSYILIDLIVFFYAMISGLGAIKKNQVTDDQRRVGPRGPIWNCLLFRLPIQ